MYYAMPQGSLLRPADERPVPFGLVDDVAIGLLVRYVGAQASGTVEVAADGNITLKHGPVGSEVVDTTVGLPTLNGVIDVSDASADTYGEVADHINASANWDCVIVDSIRSRSINDALLIKTATQARVPEGVPLLLDTDTAKETPRLIAPDAFRKDIRVYEKDYSFLKGGDGGVDPDYAFQGFRGALIRARGVATFTGALSLQVYSELPKAPFTQELLWNEAGAATGVEKVFNFENGPLQGAKDARLVVSLQATTTFSASGLNGFGVFFRALS